MQGIANMIALALENAALLEANTRAASLAEANRLKDEFLSIASHELKTPMTTIQGYVQVLHRRVSQENVDRTALIRVVDIINDQTKRMNRLVDELLDISRIEAGRLEVRHDVVDLEELLTQVVEQQQMTSEQITIRLQVAEGAVHLRVMGDEARLQQVVLNLLSNALKYSPDQGSVTVALQHEADAAVISVADKGVGISKKEQQHLFERFFRTEGARQSGVDGLGLGLYIASSIVKEHGGRMWVQSQPGQGSTFFFTVPLAQD
jgi:signal transduction histidine kinase